jgi:thiosulfate/3-mercaptopyruvate sulfurtransferase
MPHIMANRLPTVTTDELVKLCADPGVQLIDVRSPDAYNGWRLRHELRGGHIPGARSLPARWAQYIDWLEIVHAKGLDPAARLVLYGYEPETTNEVARQFARAGFSDLHVYHDFTNEWTTRDELPLVRLPRYCQLVPPQWLDELLRTGNALQYDNDRYVLCHAHYQNRDAYDEGHIPGAIEMDTNTLESPDTWNRRSPDELKKTLEESGITHDTTVILYGRFSFPDYSDPFPGSSAGHLGAMRCALIMLYAGVKDVRILNGGLQAWVDEGFTLATRPTLRKPVPDFGATIPQHPEYIVDTPEARRMLADPDANLVSVRSWREIIGEVSGYHYIEKAGRIPGAVFGNCGSDAYHMENYRNVDHTCREYHEIERMWQEAGITPDKHNAFYCGTGWRGSEAFINAWLMDWPRISLYDGGWFEWSSDPANPIDTGIPDRTEQPMGSNHA